MKKIILLGILLNMCFMYVSAQCNKPNSIVKVYKTKNLINEFVIFKIKKPFTGSYIVRNQSTPILFPLDDGGENITSMNGCRFKEILFKNMYWMCSPLKQTALPTYRIEEVRRVGNFEAVVRFLIGYKCPSSKYIGDYSYSTQYFTYVVLKFRKF